MRAEAKSKRQLVLAGQSMGPNMYWPITRPHGTRRKPGRFAYTGHRRLQIGVRAKVQGARFKDGLHDLGYDIGSLPLGSSRLA